MPNYVPLLAAVLHLMPLVARHVMHGCLSPQQMRMVWYAAACPSFGAE